MRRKPRKLTDDDRALWKRVAETATPLHRQPMAPAPPPTKPDPRDRVFQPLDPVIVPSPSGPVRRKSPPKPTVSLDLMPDPMDRLRQSAPSMDVKTLGRLKRGKLLPEARIDLHGMTAERAHGVLRGFILDAQARNLRLVLVITGKGRMGGDGPQANPARRGILRNAVPQWLSLPPLGQAVLQIVPAHDRHGGGGAYYIYLRRRR